MGKKTAVGAADFPEELPSENIKLVIFREDGSIEKIEYYDPIDRKGHKHCYSPCHCHSWNNPYTVTYTSETPYITSSGSTTATFHLDAGS